MCTGNAFQAPLLCSVLSTHRSWLANSFSFHMSHKCKKDRNQSPGSFRVCLFKLLSRKLPGLQICISSLFFLIQLPLRDVRGLFFVLFFTQINEKNVFKKTRGTIPANILNYNITELCGAAIAETLFKFYFHPFIIKPQSLLIRFTIHNILQSKIALDFIFLSFAHLQFVNMIFFLFYNSVLPADSAKNSSICSRSENIATCESLSQFGSYQNG